MEQKNVMVVGGSRGLGRAVADAARTAGARVTAVARSGPVAGDATDEAFADKVLAEHRPDLLVVTAGAVPVMRPLTEHTWETFATNWNTDVRIAFGWLRAAMRLPLAPGSRVIVFGSAAELLGASPLSGGYAGAKATIRMITGYAAAEARNLGITMTTVLPTITPGTGVGEIAMAAYGRRGGPDPDAVGAAVLTLPTDSAAYVWEGDGFRAL
ncbi:SDR family oxidoreductase [Paractinoplanes ferrugineus]|uniref:Short-chain dehydrogenase n=1 Tax=Paractinoplanes ferrugineus TaxID=113564 RepID=A0A919MKH9_9ACTN|nr:SDR family oxidoreductase [Actinoplanes ferrugineus]GIE15780.1 short-chain dehydrogenase [Actinoplanes ferrugineus]